MSHDRWARPCSLAGCPTPYRAHHHHMVYGHLGTYPCHCWRGGEPGTRLNPPVLEDAQ